MKTDPQLTTKDKPDPANLKPQGFTLRYKVITGFGGLMLIMTVCIAFTLYKLADIEKSTVSVIEHRQPTTVMFLTLQQDLNLAIALLNEFLLTGKESDIARYQLVENRLDGYINNIQEISETSDDHISAEAIVKLQTLLAEFKNHGPILLQLRMDRQANYPGMALATETLNPLALEFIGLINEILNEDDIEAPEEKAKEARALLHEIRYTWSQMMNSLRLYFNQAANRDMDNFTSYSETNGKLLQQLNDMDIEIGFDAVDILSDIHDKYLEAIPPVLEFRQSEAWRSDVNILQQKVRPIVVELRALLNKLAFKQLKASSKSGDALTSNLEQIRTYTIIMLALALSIGLLLSAMITRSILPPIKELMEAAGLVSSGDLNAEIHIKSKDEVGLLGGSFNTMVNGLREAELEKHQYTQTLELLNEELEGRVASRTADLERSEARIRTIYDNVGEGIIVINDAGMIDSLNPAAKRIFSPGDTELTGMHAVVLIADQTTEGLAIAFGANDDEENLFKGCITNHRVEIEGQQINGTTFPMEMVVTNMSVGDENMHACIVRDITKRKEAELRLAEAQSNVVNAAHKSGMAEMATGVLHNIGNILNSVNVSVDVVSRVARNSKTDGLNKANAMLAENRDNLGEFISNDSKGKKLPDYYLKLGNIIDEEMKHIVTETTSLSEKITMMKEVISTQQAYATAGFLTEEFPIGPLVEDALKVQEASLHKWGVKVTKNFADTPNIAGQKSKLLQVITNLIKNAKEATFENDALNKAKELTIDVGLYKDKTVYVSVTDNGTGIENDNLSNIFNHGFTTKEGGHGFGLHTSANSMTEMGGTLTVNSDGTDMGSCFTISIPIADSKKSENSNENTGPSLKMVAKN